MADVDQIRTGFVQHLPTSAEYGLVPTSIRLLPNLTDCGHARPSLNLLRTTSANGRSRVRLRAKLENDGGEAWGTDCRDKPGIWPTSGLGHRRRAGPQGLRTHTHTMACSGVCRRVVGPSSSAIRHQSSAASGLATCVALGLEGQGSVVWNNDCPFGTPVGAKFGRHYASVRPQLGRRSSAFAIRYLWKGSVPFTSTHSHAQAFQILKGPPKAEI